LITSQTHPAARKPLDDLRQASKHSARTWPGCRARWGGRAPNCGPTSAAFLQSYVIFFRYLDDAILEIVHIIEGHRDVAAIFARDDGVQN
jgi:hypothetical protein